MVEARRVPDAAVNIGEGRGGLDLGVVLPFAAVHAEKVLVEVVVGVGRKIGVAAQHDREEILEGEEVAARVRVGEIDEILRCVHAAREPAVATFVEADGERAVADAEGADVVGVGFEIGGAAREDGGFAVLRATRPDAHCGAGVPIPAGAGVGFGANALIVVEAREAALARGCDLGAGKVQRLEDEARDALLGEGIHEILQRVAVPPGLPAGIDRAHRQPAAR